MNGTQLAAYFGYAEKIGRAVAYYGLGLIFFAFGLYKFTPEEAAAIEPLLIHSPFLSWLHAGFGAQGASNVIGIVELAIALAIFARRFLPRAAAFGCLGAAGSLVVTVSFLFTTPGISEDTAGFLIKDVLLFGIAMWAAGEAWAMARSGARSPAALARSA
jgi:uncharacterized membrane protein YkgB